MVAQLVFLKLGWQCYRPAWWEKASKNYSVNYIFLSTYHYFCKNARICLQICIFRITFVMIARIFQPWFHTEFLFNVSPPGRTYNKALPVIKSHVLKVKLLLEKLYQLLKDHIFEKEVVRSTLYLMSLDQKNINFWYTLQNQVSVVELHSEHFISFH